MRTIEVTDETYEFLLELSAEINNQDHRGTRMPYFFQIRETKEVPTGEHMGDEVWVIDGDIALRTREDRKKAVFEYKEWTLGDEADEEAFNGLCEYSIEEILEQNYSKHYVTTADTYSNAFLTSKAADDHIKANRHNLTHPVNFLSYAHRNPQLERVMKFLCELTGGKLHT